MKAFARPYFRYRYALRAVCRAATPAGTMAPGAVPRAYQYPANLGAPKRQCVYGVVSLGGAVSSSDVAAFCHAGGYPTPSLQVLLVGGATQQSDPGGANVENQLDVQRIVEAWAHAYPSTPATVKVALAPNDGMGIANAVDALRQAGCNVISISWGAPEQEWDATSRSMTDAALKSCADAGIPVCVASGDSSIDDGERVPSVDYPCGSAYVWAVGGTALALAADGSRRSEKAWGDGRPGDRGGGGGFDPNTVAPSWQTGIVPRSGGARGCPDSSLNADPRAGYQCYSDGTWDVVGGTSAAAPSTAGLLGVLYAAGADLKGYQAKLYAARATAFYDIITGSNGEPAAPGWDAATGLGSINGPGFAAALLAQTTAPPAQPPAPQPTGGVPVSSPIQTGRPVLSWIIATIEHLLASGETLAAVEAWVAALKLPAWEVFIINQILEKLAAKAGASANVVARDAAPSPDFAALLASVQADIAPVQQAQQAAAALPGLQTKLSQDVAALTAALQPLLPTTA